MAQGPNSNHQKVSELLQEIFDLWTDISNDDEGDEVKSPASKKEAIKSRKILNDLSQITISDEDQKSRYEDLDRIVTGYEETLAYGESPNGKADSLQTEIYNLWTNITYEDDNEYHSPASIEEVDLSWPIIKKIEKLDIDDEEIKARLKLHKEILESFTESLGDDNNYDKAWEKLANIYTSWSSVRYEGDDEFRSPDSRKEIRISRALIEEVRELNVEEQDVIDRTDELEEVVDSIDSTIPDNRGKMIRSIIFSLLIILGLVFISNYNTFKSPEFEYNKEWFVTNKGGDMFLKGSISDVEMPDIKQKIYLRKNTQLKPIARIGTEWFQVETKDGQRGFIKNTLLKGMRFAEAKSKVNVFKKVGDKKYDTITKGTKVTVLESKKWRVYSNTVLYVKIRLENGRVKWAVDSKFNYPIYTDIPDINTSFFYRTNLDKANENILGKSITEIEKRYGPASSILKVRDTIRAYFKHLVIVNERKNHKGVAIILNDSLVAQAIEINEYGKGRFYNIFPLVNTIRNFETNKIFNYSFYTDNEIKLQWWQDFRDINWITGIIAWIVKWLLRAIIFILIFLIPWAVASPIINSFAFSTRFSNDTLKLYAYLFYLPFSYVFFTFMILIMDQWLIPALITLLDLGMWSTFYIMNLEYNRCPNCNTMHSALDKGTTFKGQSSSSTWGTYDVDKGTTRKTTSLGEGRTLTTTTQHYERREKKTTTTVRRYLDHRTCFRCGYAWDISRTETDEHTAHY